MAVKFGGAVSLINFGRTYVVLISAGSILQNLGLGIDWKSIIYTKNQLSIPSNWNRPSPSPDGGPRPRRPRASRVSEFMWYYGMV